MLVRVGEEVQRQVVADRFDQVGRPHRFQCQPVAALQRLFFQSLQDRAVPAFPQQSPGLIAIPFVRVGKQVTQCRAGLARQVHGRDGCFLLVVEAINPAARFVPGVERVEVGGPFVVPVGHVHTAVGSLKTIDGPEPDVLGGHQVAAVGGGETRSLRHHLVPVDRVRQQVAGDVLVAHLRGVPIGLINDAATGHVSALELLVRDVLEVAVGVGIVQGAVLGEALHVVGALQLVQHREAAIVGAGDAPAVLIEIKPVGVASPFRKQLEAFRGRVIPPDALLKLDRRRLGVGRVLDFGRHGAAVSAVEPAIRGELQRVRVGMRVLHAKAGEQNDRVAIGNVIAVLIGVEEQIRRLDDVEASVAEAKAGREVQVGQKVLGLGVFAILVRFGKDGDAIDTFGTLGRRFRHAVPDRSQILVLLQRLQTGRIRILQVLQNPQTAPVIKLHAQRLPDERFGSNQRGREPLRKFHLRDGLRGAESLGKQR